MSPYSHLCKCNNETYIQYCNTHAEIKLSSLYWTPIQGSRIRQQQIIRYKTMSVLLQKGDESTANKCNRNTQNMSCCWWTMPTGRDVTLWRQGNCAVWIQAASDYCPSPTPDNIQYSHHKHCFCILPKLIIFYWCSLLLALIITVNSSIKSMYEYCNLQRCFSVWNNVQYR